MADVLVTNAQINFMNAIREAMPEGHKNTEVAVALAWLAHLQAGTAPVLVQIGTTDEAGQVRHGVIVVKDAPPRVVRELAALMPGPHLTGDGLYIGFTVKDS